MIKDIRVVVISTSYNSSWFAVKFQADLTIDDGRNYSFREEIELEHNQMDEQTIKAKILKRVEDYIHEKDNQAWTRRLQNKEWKNEDFAFSKLFDSKK